MIEPLNVVRWTRGIGVSRIDSEVLRTFTQRLHAIDEVAVAVVDQLCTLLSADKLPKPDTLVALFAAESGDRRA